MKVSPTVLQGKKGKLQPFCISSNSICSVLLLGWGASGSKNYGGICPKVALTLGA